MAGLEQDGAEATQAPQRYPDAERRPADRLAETAALLQVAQRAGGIGLFQWWPETGALDVTDEYRSIFGIGPGVPVTQDMVMSLVHPHDRRLTGARQLEAGVTVSESEYRIRRADTGEERWIARRCEMWAPEHDTPRLIGVVQDVTRRKADEAELIANKAALEANNSQLERLVAERTQERDRMWHVSQDAFVVFDRNFNHVAVSPAFEQLLGWTAEETVGHPARGLIHPDDRERAFKVRTKLLAGGRVNRSENRAMHRDGSWRWLAWTAVPDGDRIYAVARDVTAVKARVDEIAAAKLALEEQIAERERVEATLRQMQRLEAVGQLTAGIAHDFNNLLTVIIGNLGPLARTAPDPATRRRIALMEQAANRGAMLTAQLLAFSRRQRLETRIIDLNETVAGMHGLLDTSVGGGVQLSMELSPGLWPALADETQVELVILNLAINARDAMPEGGALTIKTSNRTLSDAAGDVALVDVQAGDVRAGDVKAGDVKAGEYVAVSVADNGTGMTAEVAAKAFEPFFTTKEVGRGSGLGLAQVYGFAKQSGGGVVLETALGRGTVMTVLLPRAMRPIEAHAVPDEPIVPVMEQRVRSVLLVDDDEAVREVTASLLHEMGFCVQQAESGGAALEMAEAWDQAPDVALVDFLMPGMNGMETASLLRALHPSLPIVFVTGYADLSGLPAPDGTASEIMVLAKPFREAELRAMIERALGAQGLLRST